MHNVLKSKEVFIPYSRFNTRAFPSFVSYINKDEPILMHRFGLWGGAWYDKWPDIISYDNGNTWSDPVVFKKTEDRADGTYKYCEHGTYFEEATGKLISVSCAARFPQDAYPSTMDLRWELYIETYDPAAAAWSKPLVTDLGNEGGVAIASLQPIKTSKGRLIFPIYRPYVDEEGNCNIHAPGQVVRIEQFMVALGDYQPDGAIRWHPSSPVPVHPDKTDQGLNEAAPVELKDGRIAVILRGDSSLGNSTDPYYQYKWVTISQDHGETWSDPDVLRFTDGEHVPSPGTRSSILRSIKNGRIYWIGIINPNAKRRSPRYPWVMAEIQEEPFAVKRETVTIIDTQRPGEDPAELANWVHYQDRETAEVVVFMAGQRDYWRYRIEVPESSHPGARGKPL